MPDRPTWSTASSDVVHRALGQLSARRVALQLRERRVVLLCSQIDRDGVAGGGREHTGVHNRCASLAVEGERLRARPAGIRQRRAVNVARGNRHVPTKKNRK